MDASFLFRSLVSGFVATFSMLLAEIPAFRRFGRRGVFEWHEIHASLSRGRRRGDLGEVFVFPLHLLIGSSSGLSFAIALSFVRLEVPLAVAGLALGVGMWLVTLAIHGRVTGVHPWRNDMGYVPVAASLAGHVLYGAALGLLLSWP
jgi:hypothetical protein